MRDVLVRLECDYCHANVVIPAADPQRPGPRPPEIADWVNIVYQDEAFVFCSPKCAVQVLKLRSEHPLPTPAQAEESKVREIVGFDEQGNTKQIK